MRNCYRNSVLRPALEVLDFGPWHLRLSQQMLLLVWSREKEWEEILWALEMLLEVDSTALVDRDTTHSSRRISVGGGPYRNTGKKLLLPLSASSSDLLHLMETLPGMPTGHSLSCWR